MTYTIRIHPNATEPGVVMIRHLGQITSEIIEGWPNQFEERNGGYFCKKGELSGLEELLPFGLSYLLLS